MKDEIYVIGEYVSGVTKRPDLVGKPCVLLHGDDGVVLTVMAGDEPESFNFPYDSINGVKSDIRLLVSENMGQSKDRNWPYAKLIAYSLNGLKGYRNARMAEIRDQAFNNTIGKMEYSKRRELIIEYHNETGDRRLFIYADSNPRDFINHFNYIKR